MATPRAVQRRAEKARELARQAGQGNAQPQAQPAPQFQPAPSVQQEAQAQPQAHPPVQQAAPVVQPVESQPIHEPVQPVTQVTPDSEADFNALGGSSDPANNDWETRYKNLRKAGDERSKILKAQVDQLERQVLDLTAKLDKASGAPSSDNPYALTDDERKEMSADAVVAFEKMAAKQQRIDSVKQDTNEADGETLFFADVDSQVPGWQAVNRDPKFIEWLKQSDGFGGGTRQDTLRAARVNLDSETVVTLFSAYANEVASPDSNHGQVQQAPVGEVQPGRSGFDPNATQGAPAEIITQAQIKDFYAQKAELLRRRKMTPQLAEQFAARDLQIREAIRDGRVR